jgi:hypothetical protein
MGLMAGVFGVYAAFVRLSWALVLHGRATANGDEDAHRAVAASASSLPRTPA